MADLDNAIAAAREAEAAVDAAALKCDVNPQAWRLALAKFAERSRDLLTALDAARGQAVAWADDDEIKRSRQWGGSFNAWLSKYPGNDTPLYAAPPAAVVPDGLRNAEQTLALLIRKHGDEADAAALAMLAAHPH